MEKNQPSRGALAGVPSTHNRQLFLARFFLLALFLVLSLMSLEPKTSKAADQKLRVDKVSFSGRQASASVRDCAQQCQQEYVQCLASGRDPAQCDSQYNSCIAGCLPSNRPEAESGDRGAQY
jgi:hypothetical protein